CLLVRHLSDDDLVGTSFFKDLGPGAQRDLATPGPVAVINALQAADDAPRREVRSLYQFNELVHADIRLIDDANAAVADLAEIVRRVFRGQADRDAVRAVDQEIGELARQYQWLAILAVVIVHEIDGVALQVLEHLAGDGREARLGIAH